MRGMNNTEVDALFRSTTAFFLDIEELRQQQAKTHDGKLTTENRIHMLRKGDLRKVYLPTTFIEKLIHSISKHYEYIGVKKTLKLLSPQ